jgi:hypothetical protein
MKVMWLLYDSTYALIDIRCGSPDTVDREVMESLIAGEAYTVIRISCEMGKSKVEVFKVGNGVVEKKELNIDGRELIYSSVTACSEQKQGLEILLRDIYRGGVVVDEKEKAKLKQLSEILSCS